MRREWVGIFQALLLGLTLTAYVGAGYALSSRAFTADFVQFFASAQSLVAGESMYAPRHMGDFNPAPAEQGTAPVTLHPNLNPPLLALLLAPLTFFGLSASYIAWSVFSLLSGLFACAVMWRGLRQVDSEDSELVWLWIALLVYFPTYTALTLGQVTFYTLLPLAGAWLAARRGHDRLAGILVGVAVGLKVFVALLVIFFALQRRWRVVAWSVVTILFTVLVTLPFVGVGAYIQYFAVIRTVTWFGNSWNASYAAVITRVLGGSENVPLVNLPALAHGLVLLCSTATLLWLALVTRPKPGAGHSLARFDLGYGLTVTVMLLVSPLGWMYYFPLLLLPGYTVWSLTRHRNMRSLRWGLLVAWGMSTIPVSMVRAMDVNDPIEWFTTNSIYFYALFTMAIVVSRALVRCESTVRRRARQPFLTTRRDAAVPAVSDAREPGGGSLAEESRSAGRLVSIVPQSAVANWIGCTCPRHERLSLLIVNKALTVVGSSAYPCPQGRRDVISVRVS